MLLTDFLKTVITTPEGYFNLSIADNNGENWRQLWFDWPHQVDVAIDAALAEAPTHNVYFSPHLFSERRALKKLVLPTRTIVADLDEADVFSLPVSPSILVKTSENRHQAYWVLREADPDIGSVEIPPELLEQYSRRLTYAIPACDLSGWPLGHRFRLPETYNHKYEERQFIQIVQIAGRRIDLSTLEVLPEVDYKGEPVEGWINLPHTPIDDIPPTETVVYLAREGKISTGARQQYSHPVKDRSATLWRFMCELFAAGYKRDLVYWLAYNHSNNKFASRRSSGARDLRKDVIRAELHTATHGVSIKESINKLRKNTGLSPADRQERIADAVLNYMRSVGSFVHGTDDLCYYVRSDDGRPFILSLADRRTQAFLTVICGVNPAQAEYKYVVHHLQGYTYTIPVETEIAALSYFDQNSRLLFIHTGRKEVITVTRDTVSLIPNGSTDVLFTKSHATEPFVPSYDPLANGETWHEFMFNSSIESTLNMPPESARAILAVWTLFTLMRTGLTRPVLALFGQPGCLSGQDWLGIRRGEHSERLYTLEQLYHLYNGKWDRRIPTRIRSMKDRLVQWREIDQIVASGKRTTFTITVEGQEPFRATRDHKFLTPEGYKPLSDLRIGDKVVILDKPLGGKGRSLATRSIVAANYHPYANQKLVDGYGPYGSILFCRAVLEAAMNGLSIDDFLNIVHKHKTLAGSLEYLPSDIHIHHKDENPENNSIDNLEAMSKEDHDRLHGYKNVRNLGEYSGVYSTRTAAIESIVEFGAEHTYDIVMKDQEAPNFLVNNVVVHNSGKSTTFRIIYRLLYGRMRDLHHITNEPNFNLVVCTNPVVVYDNVDTWERWLPDALALSTGNTTTAVRMLYTDQDILEMRRQAMVGITAHSPKFVREDVADRLIVLMLPRRSSFTDEKDLLERVSRARPQLWGAVIKDIQKILATPKPNPNEVPSFRMQDFATYGLWIARGMGLEAQFLDALANIKGTQSDLVIEGDQPLVDALTTMLDKKRGDMPLMTVGELFIRLTEASNNPLHFQKTYKSASKLGSRLWTMAEPLRQYFEVEMASHPRTGQRLWRFKLKVPKQEQADA